MKDKAKLVPKKIRDKNGKLTTVWVSPNGADNVNSVPKIFSLLKENGIKTNSVYGAISTIGLKERQELKRLYAGEAPVDHQAAKNVMEKLVVWTNVRKYKIHLNRHELQMLDDLKGNIPNELFYSDKKMFNIGQASNRISSHYNHATREIVVGMDDDEEQRRLFAHEFMHCYLDINNWLENGYYSGYYNLDEYGEPEDKITNPELQAIYDTAKSEWDDMKKSTDKEVKKHISAQALLDFPQVQERMSGLNILEELNVPVTRDVVNMGGAMVKTARVDSEYCTFSDMIKGIDVKYGFGHDKGYMIMNGKNEFFAELSTALFTGNIYTERFFPKALKQFSNWINSEVSKRKKKYEDNAVNYNEIFGQKWARVMEKK